jgi:hypothetical protein
VDRTGLVGWWWAAAAAAVSMRCALDTIAAAAARLRVYE